MQTVRLFVEVTRCRSFSKAAAVFGISQSAASQRIGQLERRLGVKLIDRSVRPFELTHAGELYLLGAKDTLKKFDEMERRVSSMGQQPDALTGVVRVSAIYSFGIEQLSEIATAFERDMPGVTLQVSYRKPDAVCAAVVEQDEDLGIVSYPDRCKRVAVQPLRDEVMALVCGPGHELAKRRAVSASELADQTMVAFDLDLPVGRRVKSYLAEHDATPSVSHRFDNLDTLKGAVAVTDVCAVLPRRAVRREVASGALCAVRLTPKLTRPLGIITKRGSRPTPAAKAFIDALLAKVHADPDHAASADTSNSH